MENTENKTYIIVTRGPEDSFNLKAENNAFEQVKESTSE